MTNKATKRELVKKLLEGGTPAIIPSFSAIWMNLAAWAVLQTNDIKDNDDWLEFIGSYDYFVYNDLAS